jgi:PAS domain-containing protein
MNPEQSPMVEKEVKHTPLTNDEEALRRAFDGSRLSIYTTESSAPVMRDFLWFIDTLRPLKSQLSSLQEENKTAYSLLQKSFIELSREHDKELAKVKSQSKRIEELTGENERLTDQLLQETGKAMRYSQIIEDQKSEVSRLTGEVERLKNTIEGLAPKSEMSQTVDPNGYATSAAKILHALNLVIGEDVNEFAMPVIIQIIKNNLADIEPIRIELRQKDSEVIRLREALETSGDLIVSLDNYIKSIEGKNLKWSKSAVQKVEELSNKYASQVAALSNSSTTKE